MTADFKHGRWAYLHHRCRCPVCRAANTAACARHRARRRRTPRRTAHPPRLLEVAVWLRERRGLSFGEVAGLTGVPKTTVWRHVTGNVSGRTKCK